MTVEKSHLTTGEHLTWQNRYDKDRQLAESDLDVDGRHTIRFVVERKDITVVKTVAYAPDKRVLFIYHDRPIVYIHRNGSPVDGGRFERIGGVEHGSVAKP